MGGSYYQDVRIPMLLITIGMLLNITTTVMEGTSYKVNVETGL